VWIKFGLTCTYVHKMWPDFGKSTISNIYGQNNALYSTSQPYGEYRVSVYTELPENLWNILIGTYVQLW